ncbi:MAG TPA: isoprenylcysteine carboxylmethyltransferase family protein [Anaerolineales bacterium]|nr:isoprenylcysteine carboxylmethyltransferase family protein [Anaerolineales bacterium]
MNTTDNSQPGQPKSAKFMPLWQAYPLAFLVWGVLPWAISLLAPRYGWLAGRPGTWNLLGLILVLVGTTGLIWGMALHASKSPEGIEWELDRSYLLRRGLYAYSRHPMYLSELILLFGWVIFYGSVALLIVFVIWYLFFNYYQMPLEERILEARFGETYREYKSKVPRWFGKV